MLIQDLIGMYMNDNTQSVSAAERVNRPALLTGSFVPQRESNVVSACVNHQCNSGGRFRIIKGETELFEAGAEAARSLLKHFARE